MVTLGRGPAWLTRWMASAPMVIASPAERTAPTGGPASDNRSSWIAPCTTVIAAVLSPWSWKPVSCPAIQETT